jgi:hypothetical protein
VHDQSGRYFSNTLKYWASLQGKRWLWGDNIDDFMSQLSRTQIGGYHPEAQVVAGSGERLFLRRLLSQTTSKPNSNDPVIFLFRLSWVHFQLSPLLRKNIKMSDVEWMASVAHGTFQITSIFGDRTRPALMAGQRINDEQPPPVLCNTTQHGPPSFLAIDAHWKHRYGVIPVCKGGTHFFTLVADFKEHIIYMYDLLLHSNSQVLRSDYQKISFRDSLMQIVGDALNHAMEVSEKPNWTHTIVLGPVPLQQDAHNCGVIVCIIAWLTVRRGRPPTYEELRAVDMASSVEMKKIRMWMAYSSLHDQLWLPPEFEIWHHALANYNLEDI